MNRVDRLAVRYRWLLRARRAHNVCAISRENAPAWKKPLIHVCFFNRSSNTARCSSIGNAELVTALWNTPSRVTNTGQFPPNA